MDPWLWRHCILRSLHIWNSFSSPPAVTECVIHPACKVLNELGPFQHAWIPSLSTVYFNGNFSPSRIEPSDIYIEQEGGVVAVGADPSTLPPTSVGNS